MTVTISFDAAFDASECGIVEEFSPAAEIAPVLAHLGAPLAPST